MDSGKIKRSLGRNAQRTIKMKELAAQIPDDGTGKKSGTFKKGVLVPTPESNVALDSPKTPYVPDEFEREMYGDDYDPNEKIDYQGTFDAYENQFGVDKSSFSSKRADGSKFQIGNQPGNTEPKGISTGTGIDKGSFAPSTSKVTPEEGGRKKSSMADDFSKEMSPQSATTPQPSDEKLEQLIALQTENNRLMKANIKATKDLDA